MRDGFGRLVLGDVIVGMNGRPVKKEADLFGGCTARCTPRFCALRLLQCQHAAQQPGSWRALIIRSNCCLTGATTCPALLPPHPTDILDGCKVGETVKVEVLRRGGQRKVLSVQLAERQPETTE